MGLVANRQDIVEALKDVGLEIVRTGKTYLTFIDPDTNKHCRLKGGMYDADWSLERTAAIKIGAGQAQDSADNQRRVGEFAERLERSIAKRAEYNRGSYCRNQQADRATMQQIVSSTRGERGGIRQSPVSCLDSQLDSRQWMPHCNTHYPLPLSAELPQRGGESENGHRQLGDARSSLQEETKALARGTWGIRLVESEKGVFIVLPQKKTLQAGWTVGKNPAWEME